MPEAPSPPPGRHDPYRAYRFRVGWGWRTVAGFEKARLSADSKLAPLQLERGITLDARFDAWARGAALVPASGAAPGLSPADGPGMGTGGVDLVLAVFDLAGRPVVTYALAGCRPARCVVLPDIDRNANAVGFEVLEIAHAGWKRLPQD